jgi:hypothetical protein
MKKFIALVAVAFALNIASAGILANFAAGYAQEGPDSDEPKPKPKPAPKPQPEPKPESQGE